MIIHLLYSYCHDFAAALTLSLSSCSSPFPRLFSLYPSPSSLSSFPPFQPLFHSLSSSLLPLLIGGDFGGTGERFPPKFEVEDGPCIRPPIFREVVFSYACESTN